MVIVSSQILFNSALGYLIVTKYNSITQLLDECYFIYLFFSVSVAKLIPRSQGRGPRAHELWSLLWQSFGECYFKSMTTHCICISNDNIQDMFKIKLSYTFSPAYLHFLLQLRKRSVALAYMFPIFPEGKLSLKSNTCHLNSFLLDLTRCTLTSLSPHPTSLHT